MAELVKIGNSRGVRIPKALIEQAGLEGHDLEFEIVRNGLLVRLARRPRQGWAEAVEAALDRGEVDYDEAWLEADLDSGLDTKPGFETESRMHVGRFEIYLVDLDPVKGSEMNKRRPCVVVSPDELNGMAAVIVAPLTSRGFDLPSRVPCTFQGTQGRILLDHLRALDKIRLTERVGTLDLETQYAVCEVLQEMFAY